MVVPCFDEERRLLIALETAERHLEPGARSFELILVDDGSSDGTSALIQEAERRRAYVRGIRLPHRGKGRAVVEGVRASRGEMVLISDVDFSAPIDELPKLETAVAAGADLAIGSRAAPGARELDQPLYRRAMGKTFNLLVQALLLPGIWDTQCGFKLLRGEVARELCADLRTDGFAYDVELLYRARRAGYRVCEVPVRWINSDTTRVSALRDPLLMFADLLRIRFRR